MNQPLSQTFKEVSSLVTKLAKEMLWEIKSIGMVKLAYSLCCG
jgi:hypothetical protein